MKKIPKKYKENFIFDEAGYFLSNNISKVKIGEYLYFMNIRGEFLQKIKCTNYCLGNENQYSMININDKWGILDKEHKFIIPPIYDYITTSCNRFFEMRINGKRGVIDSENNIIIKPKYDTLYFSEQINLFFAIKNNKYGLIDLYENVIIPFEYDELSLGEYFKNKTNKIIAMKNNKMGVINLENKIVIPFEYRHLEYVAINTLIAQKSDDSYTFINNKNKQICKKSFAEILPNYNSKLSIYPARKNRLYGFIDKYGNTKIDFQYTHIGIFLNGLCEVSKKNSKYKDDYGCIDETGKLILPFEYANYSIDKINNNRFKVKKNNYEGIIDKNNNKISDFIFDKINPYFFYDKKNFLPAIISGKYGYIDENGEPLKIDKESLAKAPEIILDLSALNQVEQLKYIFDGIEVKQ